LAAVVIYRDMTNLTRDTVRIRDCSIRAIVIETAIHAIHAIHAIRVLIHAMIVASNHRLGVHVIMMTVIPDTRVIHVTHGIGIAIRDTALRRIRVIRVICVIRDIRLCHSRSIHAVHTIYA
jgi:hypothetical protein